MKARILTTVLFLCLTVASNAQIVVQGISPGTIAGSYNFTWADPNGGDWFTPDFNIPGTFVLDTLSLVEDGTPGVSTNGHNLSNEGCNTVINDPSGKIAIIYRGSCEFSLKAYNAQLAGAVGVILINNDATVIGLGGGTYGLNVTIPVVMINNADGNTLVNEMQNGPVVMLLGNQNGASSNDIGSVEDEVLISPYGGGFSGQFDGFDPGLTVHNYGTNNQSNVMVNAKIVGPTGTVYDETIGPLSIASAGSMELLPGSPNAFPSFDMGGVGNYPFGDYTLTYTLDMGVTDDFPNDNTISSDFSINDQTLALSRVNSNGEPIATDYPTTNFFEYQSCAMIQENNFNGLKTAGAYYIPHADTTQFNPSGSEIFVNVYGWNDGWVDLNDPTYQFDPVTGDAFQDLNLLTYGVHYITSSSEIDNVGYIPFSQIVQLSNGSRYLVCLQTFDSNISFGYDNALNYSGNTTQTAQPTAPVGIDGSWYIGGWANYGAPSLALDLDTSCLGTYANVLYTTNTCFGQTTGELAIETIGFSGASTISWSNGASQDTLTNLAAGTYTATISDTTGCSSYVSVTVEAIQLHIVPHVTHETCASSNDGVFEVISVTNATPPLSYQWSTGDTTMIITGLDNGSYTLTVTDSIGCTITETYNIGTGDPDFGLAAQASPDWGAAPLDVTFSNQTPNMGNYNFTWYFGDGNSVQSNASSVQHTYTTDGIWDVTLVAEDTATGCMDSTTFNSLAATNSNVGLHQIDDAHGILLKPNPNQGNFTVIANGFVGTRTVQVVTLDGKVIYEQVSTADEVDVNLPNIDAGIYLLRMADQQTTAIQRFVVH